MKIMNMELGADAVEPQSQSLLKPVTASYQALRSEESLSEQSQALAT